MMRVRVTSIEEVESISAHGVRVHAVGGFDMLGAVDMEWSILVSHPDDRRHVPLPGDLYDVAITRVES